MLTTVVTVLLLVVLAAPAHAACAWVLWHEAPAPVYHCCQTVGTITTCH